MFPNDYEKRLKDELYGCFKYIGIPIETLYNMPIQDRKYFIYRHNAEQEDAIKAQESDYKRNSGAMSTNVNPNAFAKMEQSNRKNGRNF